MNARREVWKPQVDLGEFVFGDVPEQFRISTRRSIRQGECVEVDCLWEKLLKLYLLERVSKKVRPGIVP